MSPFKRFAVKYGRWLFLEFVLRFRDRNRYVRYRLAENLRRLSSLIVKYRLVGVTITEQGESYLTTHDGLRLFYNHSDARYALGDGQGLDFKSNNTVEPIEALLLDFLQRDMVYFDIGANNGYFYSLKAAKKGCLVFAFEPNPKILLHLSKNIVHNNMGNVRAIPEAVSDSVGIVELAANFGASAYLVDTSTKIETVQVHSTTLDDYIENNNIERLDVMKIDVEGGEYRVLRGAQKSIGKFKPIIILELNDRLLKRQNSSTKEVIAYLCQFDYRVHRCVDTNDAIAAPPMAGEAFILSTEIAYRWCEEMP